MFNKDNKYFSIVFLILFMFTISSTIYAVEEINLTKAFEIAENNNIEMTEARRSYEKSKNEIKKLNKNMDWKFTLNNNFAYSKANEYEGFKENLSLSLNKSYYSGILFSSNLDIIEKEPFEFNNLEDKLSYNLNISLPLYPKTATEHEKKLTLLEDNFEMAKLRLNNLINEKEINWLADYLSILRLKENINLIKEKEKLFLDNLNKIKKEYELGEIGEYNLLDAKISLNEVRNNMINLENQLKLKENHFYNNLGIKDKYKIKFTKEDEFIKKIKEKYQSEFYNNDLKSIYQKIKNNNIELLSLNKEIKRKKSDYELQKKKRGIEVKTNTYYQNSSYLQNENFEISIGLSLDIFDRDLANLESTELKREINYLKNKAEFIEKNKITEFNSILNENDIYKLKLENMEMKLEKDKLEVRVSKRKYNENIISRTEYLEILFEYKERKNEKTKIEDQLLINRLRMLNLTAKY